MFKFHGLYFLISYSIWSLKSLPAEIFYDSLATSIIANQPLEWLIKVNIKEIVKRQEYYLGTTVNKSTGVHNATMYLKKVMSYIANSFILFS